MLKKNLALSAAFAGVAALLLSMPAMTTAVNKPATKMANDGRAKCYECHARRGQGSERRLQACQTGLYGLPQQAGEPHEGPGAEQAGYDH